VAVDLKSLGISGLSVEQRLELIDALLDSLDADGASLELSAAQREELERRLADHEANPQDVVSWEEIQAQALSQLRR
jgi:putative addiction module component (TIGR02574 family)